MTPEVLAGATIVEDVAATFELVATPAGEDDETAEDEPKLSLVGELAVSPQAAMSASTTRKGVRRRRFTD